jgi:hypothetical protein
MPKTAIPPIFQVLEDARCCKFAGFDITWWISDNLKLFLSLIMILYAGMPE